MDKRATPASRPYRCEEIGSCLAPWRKYRYSPLRVSECLEKNLGLCEHTLSVYMSQHQKPVYVRIPTCTNLYCVYSLRIGLHPDLHKTLNNGNS